MPRGKKPAPGKAFASTAHPFERFTTDLASMIEAQVSSAVAAAVAEFQKPVALPPAAEPA